MSFRGDSNSLPSAYEADALPVAPRKQRGLWPEPSAESTDIRADAGCPGVWISPCTPLGDLFQHVGWPVYRILPGSTHSLGFPGLAVCLRRGVHPALFHLINRPTCPALSGTPPGASQPSPQGIRGTGITYGNTPVPAPRPYPIGVPLSICNPRPGPSTGQALP